jgi:rRNA maturation endonuclease Nob1
MSGVKLKIDIEEIKKEINSNWFWYKVCEGCDAVVLYENVFCTKCRGYHFNENRKRIIDQIVLRYEEKIKRDNDLEESV